MIVFFSTNFIAHAASTPTAAETGRYTARIPRRNAFPWAPVVCFFLPFGGLTRNILLIGQQLKRRNNHVRAALMHGAIVIVARTGTWEPSYDKELIYMKLPKGVFQLKEEWTSELYADIVVDSEGESHNTVERNELKLHGEFSLPAGYAFATPADKSCTEHIIQNTLVNTHRINIHRVQNPLKVLISIIQIVSAIYTMKQSIGAQITRWGYASYGLSVFPYALMSIMNLVCAGVVGEYHHAHVLRTPILNEAERRGAVADGTIGRVDTREATVLVGKQASSMSGYTSVQIWRNEPRWDGDEPSLTIDAGDLGIRTFKAVPPWSVPPDQKVIFKISAITHDGPAPDDTYKKYKSVSWTEIAFIGVLFAIATIIPEALIYVLTRFRPGESTSTQRGFMIAWLVADQISSFGTLASWIVWQKRNGVIPSAVHIACLALLIVPAIGGLATVGQTYLVDKGFGACP
ncbi:hypothetical protein WOLCODRAFT_123897 [Wolfiporia cocos MD-104 SS10]|uniref:Uncharacterized protein n=1 Tax=Wolfiporia cocos (strain MD-104) TaxID=742152 RepID=A0A2H3JR69_WOLCO|nr:hypothetical protein WOLCODRAFT_123897 [Wolfiporia cocos MD-104 SS10]